MTHDERLAEYSRMRLAGRELPVDLRTLLLLQWQRGAAGSAADPLETMGVTLLEAGESHDLLDHSYLNDKDRADPDIMANVAAMKSTCEHAAFVARDDDGNLIGYWFGPENVGIENAALLKLDTEGQFLLLEGKTLSEALLGSHAFEDTERFAQLKGVFAGAGIDITADSWDELVYPNPATDPAAFHEERYEENGNQAG
jgi:hypothetical protein